MTITVKLGDLIAANGSLSEMGELTEIPPTSAYRIAKAIRRVNEEVKAWNAGRRNIIKQSGHAEPHPQVPGELWIDPRKITIEENDKLNGDMDALNEQEVAIEMSPMKLSELGDKFKAKPKWLADLHWLIVEG